jgi:hypothetical protein
MKKIWMSLILQTVLISGCSRPEETGLLKDYLRLERVDDTTLIYKASEDPLKGYNAMIVEPVIVDLTRPPERVIEDLRQYTELSIRKVILSQFDITDQQGEKTAIIKARLSYVRDDSPVKANEDADDILGPFLEIRICDSLSDKTLMALALKRPQIDIEGLTKWSKAKISIEYWSEHLAISLYCSENKPCEASKGIIVPSTPVKEEN